MNLRAYATNHFSLLIRLNFTAVLIMSGFTAIFAQGVTPEHIAEMQAVTNSVISEDGSYVAYTVSVPADPYEENATNSSHLHVLDVESGTSVPYYTSGSISAIRFRPGASSITFLTQKDDDDVQALYELPLGGGEAVKLFSFDRSISDYTWHHDGNHIAFSAFDEAETSDSELSYQADVYEENRPDRRAFITNVQHAENGHEPHEVQVEGTIYLMQWSPDGSQLAVSAAPTPEVDDFYMSQQVFVVDYQTREIAAEINNEGKLGQVEWSPDGNHLALRAGADINDPIDGRILVVSAEGGTPEIIDPDFEGKYEQISWEEDGDIHFLAGSGTGTILGAVNPNSSEKHIFFESEEHAVASFSRASDGTLSVVASTPEHPTELFLSTGEGNAQPERVTRLNSWLDDAELGRQKVIRYTTRDGEYEIEGILVYPTGYTEGENLPVITVVHGGPEAHYSNGWLTNYSLPGQMAAAKEYAVFYPNYRGSTGRGIDFAYSSQGDLAGKEFDDIVDGIDHLIEQGIADEDRIGVTGGSYGGYASAWMSTYYSDRFAASVMFVGISNNISKWGTSDIPEELYHVHSRKRIWDHWQDYLERSPVYYVDRAETPILIMHGADDTRVHPAQSLELYRHLKVRKPDLPVRLVFYPGEGHGNTHSSSRYDYSQRMLQWFDTYLMSGDATTEIPHWDAPIPPKD